MNCGQSTVASKSVIGQGLSCFCPAIVVGGDNVAPFHLCNKLLDGLLEKSWTRGSEVEACRAEYQSFVQEQRQLERPSTRSCPDVGNVLSFCSAQASFQAGGHLYKVCIVSNQACCFDPYEELSCPFFELLLFQIFQLTTLVIRGPATNGKKVVLSLEPVAIKEEEVRAWCTVLCEGFCLEPALHTEKFFLKVRLDKAM